MCGTNSCILGHGINSFATPIITSYYNKNFLNKKTSISHFLLCGKGVGV